MTAVALKEIIFQINSNISQDMIGSANDRFLLRSVRSNMPNSINNKIKPQELINRRIEKHEARMKGKNKRKIVYPVGTRVRIQHAKTKLFDTNGTILEHRWTDSQEVVSYVIRTDKGLVTTRHRKYLKQLHPLNDPTNYKNNLTHLNAADPDILNVETEQNVKADDTATEGAEKVGKRRSRRIKGLTSLGGISKLKINKVSVSQEKATNMGQSCSTQLKEAKEKIKTLQARVHLYENGVNDKSIHASQTNIGLINLANEENDQCDCRTSGSMIGIIEVIAIMVVSILLLYILYCCCIKYNNKRQADREKRRGLIMAEMENRMGRTVEGKRNLAIEMGPSPSAPSCGRDHLHVPQFHNNQNATASKGTQQEVTF